MLLNILFPIIAFLSIQANLPSQKGPDFNMLANRQISLEKRNVNEYVNSVMRDNILLNLAYMDQRVKEPSDINWEEINKPFKSKFRLDPNKTFAYHEDVLAQHKGEIELTTNAHFNFQEGFKSDGYLVGDGVCHLASLIYWAAKDAGLITHAPTNHDFAPIPEIDKIYGVSIYSMPGQPLANAQQNLYIKNSRTEPVELEFDYDGHNLKLSILKKS